MTKKGDPLHRTGWLSVGCSTLTGSEATGFPPGKIAKREATFPRKTRQAPSRGRPPPTEGNAKAGRTREGGQGSAGGDGWTFKWGSELSVEQVDQLVGGRVVGVHTVAGLQLREDRVRKLLAEFHAPLIVRVDVPDNALHENLVLVHSDKSTQGPRGNLPHHNRGGWAVALEDLVRADLLDLLGALPLLLELLLSLLVGLALHQRLGLGDKVGHQHTVVEVVRDRVVRAEGADEVARDDLGALVDELVERVLPVSARLAPDDGPGGPAGGGSVAGHKLPVGLHVTLLEVGRKAVQVLVVREDCLSLHTVAIVVPDTKHGKDDGNVLLKGGFLEVSVHLITTVQQLLEVLEPNSQHDREPDRAPQGVPSAHPVPPAEEVLSRHSELAGSPDVGAGGTEVAADDVGLLGGVTLVMIEEGALGGGSISHRLLRREGLARHNEKSALQVNLAEGLRKVGSIDVRYVVHLQPPVGVRLQRLSDHDRSEVTPPDTDVHDVRHGLAGEALPHPITHLVREYPHALQHVAHLRHHILAIHEHGARATVPESGVQHGASLGEVDLLAGEHRRAHALNTSLASEVEQETHRLGSDKVL
eukprot:Hpha_TRINITY_DN13917_c0_g2::TRINITY_DN13917_c0_g2_i1::g.35451::m.35451